MSNLTNNLIEINSNNNLKIFVNNEFGKIRTITDNEGNPWFIANDVCEILEIKNPYDAISILNNYEKSALGITDPHGRIQKLPINI
jgi:prophage antirepressor-like protein